jgi:E3 ubiquitin-protein ligase RNF115/126
MLLLQGQMQNFLGTGGNVEVFFDNGTGNPRRLPGNFGDYFLGPGLDQLIQQLAENDPNRSGAPPASKSAVEALPTIKISEEHSGTDAAQCAVCKDEFEMGASVRQMPCKHMYHDDCILPWLEQHNTCPVCRYEMPTDDQNYNQIRAAGSQGASTGTAASSAAPAANNAGAGAEGGGTSGGFTFWGSPAGFGLVPAEAVGNGNRDAGSSGPASGSQTSSAAPAAAAAATGGIGRRFSIHLPWFRSSVPPPAPAPPPPPGPGPSEGGGAAGNQSPSNSRDEPHPESE